MKLIAPVCLLVLAVLAVQAELDISQAELCKILDGSDSMFNPLRCDSGYNTDIPGRTFRAKNPKNSELDPVVILPGLGGSGLEARLSKDKTPHWYCTKNIDWFRLWLHLEELLVQDCWMANLAVEYDAATNKWSQPQGVEIRAIDFGGAKGIDYLDYQLGIPVTPATYYGTLIKSFVAAGYVVGKSLRGAPYDWRMTPQTLKQQGLFESLKTLIESTRAANNNKRVHVITHSQGCITALAFFHNMGPEWVRENVESFIPVAGPWNGAAKPLRALLSGDDFGLKISKLSLINRIKFRNTARNMGGVVYLAPTYDDWGDFVFVSTPQRNYTAADLPQLFKDMGAPETVAVYENTNAELVNLQPPFVRTYCLYGTGVATEMAYYYPNGFDENPQIESSSMGDGTVPLESLRECIKWAAKQPERVTVEEFKLLDHTAILKDQDLIHYILGITTHSS